MDRVNAGDEATQDVAPGGLAVADRLFAAIEAGDIEAIHDLYAPDAVIWHNFDDAEQSREQNVRMLGWAIRNLSGMHYTDVRRSVTDEGFVQQHVLRAVNRAGVEIAVPACLVVTVSGGLITRLDEYLDSRHVDLITGAG